MLHTHTHLTALFLGLPGWAATRQVEPIWILLKQQTVSGSGISWARCKSAPRSWQITMPAPDRSVFYRPDAFPATQPTASKHWRHSVTALNAPNLSIIQCGCAELCSVKPVLAVHCPGPCHANLHRWGPAQSPCGYGQQQTMNYIVDACPLTKFVGELNLLHEADDDAVIWLESTSTAALAQ